MASKCDYYIIFVRDFTLQDLTFIEAMYHLANQENNALVNIIFFFKSRYYSCNGEKENICLYNLH